MASILKTDEIQSQNGGAVVKMQTLKHPSASGNNLELASDGSATINQISSSTVFPAGGTGNPISTAIVAEQTSSGTDGGGFTSGSWEKRLINTEISDPDSIVSIGADNRITLNAGLYFFQYMAIAYKVGLHQVRLYDTTGGAEVSLGSSMYHGPAEGVTVPSIGFGTHQPSSSNVYELLHRCSSTQATNGRGVALNWGTNIFSYIIIYKLK